jgi:hypothetical protein
MALIAELLSSLRDARPLYGAGVAIGPRFTGVAAAGAPGGRATGGGLAYTGDEVLATGAGPAALTAAARREVLERPLYDVARAAPGQVAAHHLPREGGRADVATAALNALLAAQVLARSAPLGDENGLDLIARLARGRRLAVVGAFPYLKTIRLEAARSWVLELRPGPDEMPAERAPELLPQADVVGITGSTLANGTLEGLLALCRRDAFVAVIGPTTPLSAVLFDYGVDVLCGVLVEDPARTLESILAGGTTRRVPGTRQVSLSRSGRSLSRSGR